MSRTLQEKDYKVQQRDSRDSFGRDRRAEQKVLQALRGASRQLSSPSALAGPMTRRLHALKNPGGARRPPFPGPTTRRRRPLRGWQWVAGPPGQTRCGRLGRPGGQNYMILSVPEATHSNQNWKSLSAACGWGEVHVAARRRHANLRVHELLRPVPGRVRRYCDAADFFPLLPVNLLLVPNLAELHHLLAPPGSILLPPLHSPWLASSFLSFFLSFPSQRPPRRLSLALLRSSSVSVCRRLRIDGRNQTGSHPPSLLIATAISAPCSARPTVPAPIGTSDLDPFVIGSTLDTLRLQRSLESREGRRLPTVIRATPTYMLCGESDTSSIPMLLRAATFRTIRLPIRFAWR